VPKVAENTRDTMEYAVDKEKQVRTSDIIMQIYQAMMEKGYEPINQFVGYIISGDPTYITSYKNARYLVQTLERDELLEEFIRFYLQKNSQP
jgi:uncharacterized protein (UPF0297 family)